MFGRMIYGVTFDRKRRELSGTGERSGARWSMEERLYRIRWDVSGQRLGEPAGCGFESHGAHKTPGQRADFGFRMSPAHGLPHGFALVRHLVGRFESTGRARVPCLPANVDVLGHRWPRLTELWFTICRELCPASSRMVAVVFRKTCDVSQENRRPRPPPRLG
jgi:hypothetical protein